MLYLDTSVLVTALTNERESGRIQVWLEEHSPEEFSISDWVVTEFSSALSMKLRTGQIDLAAREIASKAFAQLRSVSFGALSVESRHFHIAATFAEQHGTGLRAADALHAAIVADRGATLCTLDRRLVAAGSALGISTMLV